MLLCFVCVHVGVTHMPLVNFNRRTFCWKGAVTDGSLLLKKRSTTDEDECRDHTDRKSVV